MSKLYTMVGMRFRGSEAAVRSMPEGEPLTLVREPNNKHDSYAVRVYAQGQFVAYVKSAEAKDLSTIMDAVPDSDFIGKLTRNKGFPYVEL